MNKKMRMVWPGKNFLIALLLLVVTALSAYAKGRGEKDKVRSEVERIIGAFNQVVYDKDIVKGNDFIDIDILPILPKLKDGTKGGASSPIFSKEPSRATSIILLSGMRR